MKRSWIAVAMVFLLSGCFVMVPVPVPIKMSNLSTVKSVPLVTAPAGSDAAMVAEIVNADRRSRGLAPLSHNKLLDKVARGHAVDMHRNDFYGHTGSDGKSPRQRLRAAGYGACKTAENVAKGYRTATAVAQAWKESAGHQRNNLDPKLLEFGVGHEPTSHKWVLLMAQPGC